MNRLHYSSAGIALAACLAGTSLPAGHYFRVAEDPTLCVTLPFIREGSGDPGTVDRLGAD